MSRAINHDNDPGPMWLLLILGLLGVLSLIFS